MGFHNVEIECFGLDYERYALGRTLKRLTEKYRIQNVLELPAGGVKAMPSIYSLGFGLSGCKVTLVNGVKTSLEVWERLGIGDRAEIYHCADITNTGLENNSYDFVWNFASFSTLENKIEVLQEMKRLSRKYITICSPNAYNPGYFSHRTAHFLSKTPWTHGDVAFYSPRKTVKFLRSQGLKIKEVGVLDSPPWPDSIGFRDIRLHRMQIDLSQVNWHSRYVDYLYEGKFPNWIHMVDIFERIPLPLFIKFFYSHLFYVIAIKD